MSESARGTGIDPRIDYAFKRLFGDPRNSDLLIDLLNAVVQPANPITSVEILNPFLEKEFAADKQAVLDIRVRDQLQQAMHIEMQIRLSPDFPERIVYGTCDGYSDQLSAGESYRELRPVISICLIDQPLYPEAVERRWMFRLLDADTGQCFSEQLRICVVELAKFPLAVSVKSKPLEIWMAFLRDAANMDPNNPQPPFDTSIFRKALQELMKMSQDQQARWDYKARETFIRDQESFLFHAHREGREEGIEIGLRKGREVGRIHLCEQLMGLEQTPADDLQSRSEQELSRLADELEARLRGRGEKK